MRGADRLCGCGSGSAGRRPWRGGPAAWPMRPMPMMPSRLPHSLRPIIQVGVQPVNRPSATTWAPSTTRRDDGQDQGHGQVGGVLGQHAGRVGDDDAPRRRPRPRRCGPRPRRNWRSASAARPRLAIRSASMRSVMVGASTSARCIAASQRGRGPWARRSGSVRRRTARASGSRPASGSLSGDDDFRLAGGHRRFQAVTTAHRAGRRANGRGIGTCLAKRRQGSKACGAVLLAAGMALGARRTPRRMPDGRPTPSGFACPAGSR